MSVRCEKINGLLGQLSSELGIDLWTLDALWWFLLEPERLPQAVMETSSQIVESGERFALEHQHEEFLLENWERTLLAKEWALFSTDDV